MCSAVDDGSSTIAIASCATLARLVSAPSRVKAHSNLTIR